MTVHENYTGVQILTGALRPATKYVVVHHTGSEHSTLENIEAWHKKQGWGGIGYHDVIDYRGRLHHTRPADEYGVHALNHNHHAYGICVMGDFSRRPPSEAQRWVLKKRLVEIFRQFPTAVLVGHGDLNDTACPGKYMDLLDIKEGVDFLNRFVSGIVKSPEDNRDWLFSRVFPLATTVARPIRYTIPQNPPTKDQLDRGTCGGFAMSYVKEIYHMIETGKYIRMSPLAIYLETRRLDAAVIPPEADGVTMRSLLKVATDYGAPYEASFQYNTTFKNTDLPPDNLKAQAWEHRALGYVRLTTMDEIEASIASNMPVAVGLYLMSNFLEAVDGVVPFNPTGTYYGLGGHAMAAIAYDSEKKLLGCKQSYGENTRYADRNGITWFPYNYVMLVLDFGMPMLFDAFSVIDFKPEPEMIVPKVWNVADGKVHVMLDGVPVKFKYVPPVIIKELGRTMLSLRDTAELFGYGVEYDATTNTVLLTSPRLDKC